MAQTLFGLTFAQALEIAEREGACDAAINHLAKLNSWGEVLQSPYLRSYVDWFSDAEVPIKQPENPSGLCQCGRCENRLARLTPEKQARSDALTAIFVKAREAARSEDGRVDADTWHVCLAAALAAELKDIPDAVPADQPAPEGWTDAEA